MSFFSEVFSLIIKGTWHIAEGKPKWILLLVGVAVTIIYICVGLVGIVWFLFADAIPCFFEFRIPEMYKSAVKFLTKFLTPRKHTMAH